jgi:hypothetical protein
MSLNIKIAAPKLDEFADAMISAFLTGGDVVKKIGKLKFEFPTPKLDKFAHALTLAVDAGKDAAKINQM